MRATKNEFPNPVLADGRDDYNKSCSFGTTIETNNIRIDSENIIIPVSYFLVSDGLNALIDNGDAVVVVTIRSSAASYSRAKSFPKGSTQMNIYIPKYSVIKRIEFVGSVIAAKSIDNFRCEGEFDPLYFGSQAFDIRKGDILACEDSRYIYIDDSELEAPISSIFRINSVKDQEESVIPVFEDDKIDINLRPDLFKLYDYFKDYNNGSLTRYITGIIVYPALIEALTKIQLYYWNEDEQDSKLEEKRWFDVIETKAEKLGVDLKNYQESVVTLADKLLGGISLDSLKSFQDTLESEMNNGETIMMGGAD